MPHRRRLARDAWPLAVAIALAPLVALAEPEFTEIGALDLPGDALDVAIAGSHAIVLADSGLVVIDVSDPGAPVRVGLAERPFGMGAAEAVEQLVDLAVSGALALVASASGGLAVYDLDDPAAPALVGTLEIPGRHEDAEIAGDVAYVGAGGIEGGLRLVSLVDPAIPVAIGSVEPGSPYAAGDTEVYGLDVDGSRLVVSALARRIGELEPTPILWVLDVATPATPTTLGIAETGAAGDVEAAGDRAYVAGSALGIAVFDLSDPGAPDELDPLDGTSSDVVDLEVADGVPFYTQGGTPGSFLKAYVSGPPPGPPIGGARPLDDPAPQLAVAGSLAVTTQGAGIAITDVSDPTLFAAEGTLDQPDDGVAVEVVGTLAYVANADMDLRVFDVSLPAEPQERSFVDLEGTDARSLAVAGTRAYLGGKQVVRILDVSDPDAPAELGAIPLFGIATAVAASGTMLFVAEAFESPDPPSVRVFDVSDPGSPDEIGSFATPANPIDFALAGTTLDVAVASDSVRILDLATAAMPDEIGSVPADGGQVERRGSVLYTIDRVAYPNAGECGGAPIHLECDDLVLWDVSAPSAPVPLGSVHLSAVGPTLGGSGNPSDMALAPTGVAYVGLEYTSSGHLTTDARELSFLDDSDPANPVVVARQYAPGSFAYSYAWVRAVDVEDQKIYAAGVDGLRIFEIPVPEPGGLAPQVLAGAALGTLGARARGGRRKHEPVRQALRECMDGH